MTRFPKDTSLQFDSSVVSSPPYAAGPFTYSWDFGDSSSSSIADPAHTYTSSGTKTATVTATNTASGETATSSQSIIIDGYVWDAMTGMAASENVTGPGIMGVSGTKMLVTKTGSPYTATYVYDFAANTWAAGPTLTYATNTTNLGFDANSYWKTFTMPDTSAYAGQVYIQQTAFGAPMCVNLSTNAVTALLGQGTYSVTSTVAVQGGDGNAYYLNLSGGFNKVMVHDLTTNTWSTKASTGPGIIGLAPIYIGNSKFFMIERDGGYGYTYDYNADTWTRSTNVSGLGTPGTYARQTLLLLDTGNVLAVGGTTRKASVWDPGTNTFTASTNLDPTTRNSSPGLFAMSTGLVHVISDNGSGSVTTSTMLDPVGLVWSGSYAMTYGRMSNVVTDPVTGKPFAFGQASAAAVRAALFDGV